MAHDRYHVIAPDHLGFGLSDAPPAEDFDYTFDALTGLTADLLARLGVTRYAVYVQDYGAPIGWRLALNDPAAITAIITQNGNGYEAGFVPDFWQAVWNYDHALVSRPGNDRVQLKLFLDYATNLPLYPRLHEYLRASQFPLLAVWGKGDEIFGPDGARAFADDLPGAEIHLLDGGRFLLESALDEVGGLVRDFLARLEDVRGPAQERPVGTST